MVFPNGRYSEGIIEKPSTPPCSTFIFSSIVMPDHSFGICTENFIEPSAIVAFLKLSGNVRETDLPGKAISISVLIVMPVASFISPSRVASRKISPEPLVRSKVAWKLNILLIVASVNENSIFLPSDDGVPKIGIGFPLLFIFAAITV